jgi:S1-C subfamily serine protease
MKNLSLTFCLAIAALFGSVNVGIGACWSPNPAKCSAKDLCDTVRWLIENKVDLRKEHNSNYIKTVQRRGLNCKVRNSSHLFPRIQPSLLRTAFIKLSKENRKQLQSNLKDLGFYKSSIDGLYGKGTAGALTTYNKQNLNGSDLKKSENVEKLYIEVLALKPSTILETEPVPVARTPVQEDDTYKVASGSGFYVTDTGHIITNYHVIEGCKDMKVHSKGNVLETKQIAQDRRNDLALLKTTESPKHSFALSTESPFPLQDVVVAGYPFGNRVSSTLKFTEGIISSIAGLGDDYSQIQIDAAIQPGNSGGPILDEYGNVVAVAVAKLSLKKILKDFGVVPENTNFGVKASAVRNLMEGNGVSFKSPNTEVISKRELSQVATDGTVYLTCWMTTAQIEQMRARKVLFEDLE